MTENKEPVTEDDPKQSESFRKAVRDLEAAGELNDTDDSEAAFKRVLRKTSKYKDEK